MTWRVVKSHSSALVWPKPSQSIVQFSFVIIKWYRDFQHAWLWKNSMGVSACLMRSSGWHLGILCLTGASFDSSPLISINLCWLNHKLILICIITIPLNTAKHRYYLCNWKTKSASLRLILCMITSRGLIYLQGQPKLNSIPECAQEYSTVMVAKLIAWDSPISARGY